VRLRPFDPWVELRRMVALLAEDVVSADADIPQRLADALVANALHRAVGEPDPALTLLLPLLVAELENRGGDGSGYADDLRQAVARL
jgi:hypothetical protein